MQGFNMGRYRPPSPNGTPTDGNKLFHHRSAGHLNPRTGSQTVRFEMPFAVWCHTCNPHGLIAQGIRFNAEKRKVGNYYSTPIFAFRCKHAVCGGVVEVRTDPARARYVVSEGGKERDYGFEDGGVRMGEGGVEILTAEEREMARGGAIEALEGRVEKKIEVETAEKRLEGLRRAKERDWQDPGAANRRLRNLARGERKARKREDEEKERLKERLGWDGEILLGNEEDERRAKLVTFREVGEGDVERDKAASKAMFRSSASAKRDPARVTKPGRSELSKETRVDALRKRIVGNTRAALNPF